MNEWNSYSNGDLRRAHEFVSKQHQLLVGEQGTGDVAKDLRTLCNTLRDRDRSTPDQQLSIELISLFLYHAERAHSTAPHCLALLRINMLHSDENFVVNGLRRTMRLHVNSNTLALVSRAADPYFFSRAVTPTSTSPNVGIVAEYGQVGTQPTTLAIVKPFDAMNIQHQLNQVVGVRDIRLDVFVPLLPSRMCFLPRLRSGDTDIDPQAHSLSAGQQLDEISVRRNQAFVTQWGSRGEVVDEESGRYRVMGIWLLPDSSKPAKLRAWMWLMDSRRCESLCELTNESFPKALIGSAAVILSDEQRRVLAEQMYNGIRIIAQRFNFSIPPSTAPFIRPQPSLSSAFNVASAPPRSSHMAGSLPPRSPGALDHPPAPLPVESLTVSSATSHSPAASRPSSALLRPLETMSDSDKLLRVLPLHPGSCGLPQQHLRLLRDLFSVDFGVGRGGGGGGYVSITRTLADLLSFGNQAPVCIQAPQHGIVAALQIARERRPLPAKDCVDTMMTAIAKLASWTLDNFGHALVNDLLALLAGMPEYEHVKNMNIMASLLHDDPRFLCSSSPPFHDFPAAIYLIGRLWADMNKMNLLFLVEVDIVRPSTRRFYQYTVKPYDDSLPIVAIALGLQQMQRDSSGSASSATGQTTYTLYVIAQRETASTTAVPATDHPCVTMFDRATADSYPLYWHLRQLCQSVGVQNFQWMALVPGTPEWPGAVAPNFGTKRQTKKYDDTMRAEAAAAERRRLPRLKRMNESIIIDGEDVSGGDEQQQQVGSHSPAIKPVSTSEIVRVNAGLANTESSDTNARAARRASRAKRKQQQNAAASEPAVVRKTTRGRNNQPKQDEEEGEEEEDEEDQVEVEDEEELLEDVDRQKPERNTPREHANESEPDEEQAEEDMHMQQDSAPRLLQKEIRRMKTKKDVNAYLESRFGAKPASASKAVNLWQRHYKAEIDEFVRWFAEQPEMTGCVQKYMEGKAGETVTSVSQMTVPQRTGLHLAVELAYRRDLQQAYSELGEATWVLEGQLLADWTKKACQELSGCPKQRAYTNLPARWTPYRRTAVQPWQDAKDATKPTEAARLAKPAYDRRAAFEQSKKRPQQRPERPQRRQGRVASVTKQQQQRQQQQHQHQEEESGPPGAESDTTAPQPQPQARHSRTRSATKRGVTDEHSPAATAHTTAIKAPALRAGTGKPKRPRQAAQAQQVAEQQRTNAMADENELEIGEGDWSVEHGASDDKRFKPSDGSSSPPSSIFLSPANQSTTATNSAHQHTSHTAEQHLRSVERQQSLRAEIVALYIRLRSTSDAMLQQLCKEKIKSCTRELSELSGRSEVDLTQELALESASQPAATTPSVFSTASVTPTTQPPPTVTSTQPPTGNAQPHTPSSADSRRDDAQFPQHQSLAIVTPGQQGRPQFAPSAESSAAGAEMVSVRRDELELLTSRHHARSATHLDWPQQQSESYLGRDNRQQSGDTFYGFFLAQQQHNRAQTYSDINSNLLMQYQLHTAQLAEQDRFMRAVQGGRATAATTVFPPIQQRPVHSGVQPPSLLAPQSGEVRPLQTGHFSYGFQ